MDAPIPSAAAASLTGFPSRPPATLHTPPAAIDAKAFSAAADGILAAVNTVIDGKEDAARLC